MAGQAGNGSRRPEAPDRPRAGVPSGSRPRHAQPGEPRTYALASSVRLPWALGLLALLGVAVVTALLAGGGGQTRLDVPRAIVDYQESITRDAAQDVRRSVNEGAADLDELGRLLPSIAASNRAELTATLKAFASVHGRYSSVYVLAGGDRVVARVGTDPVPGLLSPPPPYRSPGVQDAVRLPGGRTPAIPQVAPVRPEGQRGFRRGTLLAEFPDDELTVIGQYDPKFMRFPLEGALPGDAWVVNSRGQAIGALGEPPAFNELPRATLRQAAANAARGRSGAIVVGATLDRQEVVGYSPVSGPGPSGQLGWGVVTTRAVESFDLPQTRARRGALLAGLSLAIVALLAFAWLYLRIVDPVLRLQREAERIAHGDLDDPVRVVRYDEVGLIGRALERIRVQLLRRRMQQKRPDDPS